MADRSTQSLYQSFRRLVLPLERPEDPKQGVLRLLTRVQLRKEPQIWKGLEEQGQPIIAASALINPIQY